MEDLKIKIQSQEGIPVDKQAISFIKQSCRSFVVRKTLSWKCHQCKAVDNRSLNEFEEFRTVFGPVEKLIMPSEHQKLEEFRVGTIHHENFVKSKGSKLSYVSIKTLTGKIVDISVKVNQSKKLVRFSFRNYIPSMNIFVGPKLKIY